MKNETIQISQVIVGDTVIINDEMITVGRNNIVVNECGTRIMSSIHGASDHKTIQRVLFPKWFRGVKQGYVTQP